MRSKDFEKYRQQQAMERAVQLAWLYNQKIEAEQAEKSFKDFLIQAWPVIDPGKPFQDNWHISCLCEHLEAMAKRQIRWLIINIPPRFLKSTIISVAFPAWRWLVDPAEKFLCASYGLKLALRDSRRCRNLIASPWYQSKWGTKFSLAHDQNEKGRFENDQGGFRIIASVEGGVLGEGGSFTIYDDPNDLEKMVSEPETYPQSVREWYSGTASSRHIDPRSDVRLCVQQRSSYGDDLTEYLLELGGWEQLVIPNEYDGNKTITSIGWSDPRTHLGELLFPDRVGPEETARLKREQKTHYPGQYNQRPSRDGKGGLKREWFNFYNPTGLSRVDSQGKSIPVRITLADGSVVEKIPRELPTAFERLVDAWDMKFKKTEDSDFVAGHQWGGLGADSYLLVREHGMWNFPETLAAVRRLSLRGAPEKLVEDAANGPAVLDTLTNEIPGLIPVSASGGKWSRVASISGYVEAGNVWLPNPDLFPWVWDLLNEFAAGPAAKHDDDTDAMTHALRRLYDGMARTGVPEFRVQPRLGEPTSAQHVMQSRDKTPADWRRFVACIPGQAALWMVETPSGALRVIRELSLERLDARQTGLKIAEWSMPDLLARANQIRDIKKGSYDILLPKAAFAEVEPEGSWAEMMEHALLTYEPENGDYDARKNAGVLLREARFRSEMVEEEDAALDRLRALLAFAPPDFAPVSYDRGKAFRLAETDMQAYLDYMAMVDGEVRGEWPKLKLHPDCKLLISQLGSFRTDLDPPAYVAALLLGVCAPRAVKPHEVVERPWPASGLLPNRSRRATLISRKFALGRR